MRILALDLGRRMGVADGDSALLSPHVEAVTVRGTAAENRVRWLAEWLDDWIADKKPDLIVTEAQMNLAASKSAHATTDLLGYYFCLHAVAGLFDIPVEPVLVMTVRQHFCGERCAPPVRGHQRTATEASAARKYINEAVLRRAILLGYLPDGSKDWDQANACALWDFAASRDQKRLFGELDAPRR